MLQFMSMLKINATVFFVGISENIRVSVQGVESLWGDCRFILADWGSQ